MWKLTYKWAKYSHANKAKSWITHRYFGRFNPARADRWVFGDRTSGAYLPKFAWTKIVRHLVTAVDGARWQVWPIGHPVVRLASRRELDVVAG